MKVFPDTNIWVSGLVFPGLCAELLAYLFESEHQLQTSQLVRTEIETVLARKFARRDRAVSNLAWLWSQAACIADVPTPVDDADRRLVAAAAQGGAHLFVTGDRRVLGWQTCGEMKIVTARQGWLLLHPLGA
ncbi:MAG: putative toxin-antitoxin system toxin component, PIN family [Nevskiaceae bacterium]|nr:MAG: putative toxin-antitoxin system toxin component, PIN family [Nevskiaceae bacterium]TBR73530.1 MAG: putative toxin-antitoxin system toxin component, PIN family [Nevskiaceae bacterium]